jgi:hypothetical protein
MIMMKLFNEAVGINKKTKESLKNQLIDFIVKRTPVSKNNIKIDWKSNDDRYITVTVDGYDPFVFIITKCGMTNTKRKRSVSILSDNVLNTADGLICKRIGRWLYLVDDSGSQIFRIDGLRETDTRRVDISDLGTDTEPEYNDDVNNLRLIGNGTIYTMISILNEDE